MAGLLTATEDPDARAAAGHPPLAEVLGPTWRAAVDQSDGLLTERWLDPLPDPPARLFLAQPPYLIQRSDGNVIRVLDETQPLDAEQSVGEHRIIEDEVSRPGEGSFSRRIDFRTTAERCPSSDEAGDRARQVLGTGQYRMVNTTVRLEPGGRRSVRRDTYSVNTTIGADVGADAERGWVLTDVSQFSLGGHLDHIEVLSEGYSEAADGSQRRETMPDTEYRFRALGLGEGEHPWMTTDFNSPNHPKEGSGVGEGAGQFVTMVLTHADRVYDRAERNWKTPNRCLRIDVDDDRTSIEPGERRALALTVKPQGVVDAPVADGLRPQSRYTAKATGGSVTPAKARWKPERTFTYTAPRRITGTVGPRFRLVSDLGIAERFVDYGAPPQGYTVRIAITGSASQHLSDASVSADQDGTFTIDETHVLGGGEDDATAALTYAIGSSGTQTNDGETLPFSCGTSFSGPQESSLVGVLPLPGSSRAFGLTVPVARIVDANQELRSGQTFFGCPSLSLVDPDERFGTVRAPWPDDAERLASFTVPIAPAPGFDLSGSCGEGCSQSASFSGTATYTRR